MARLAAGLPSSSRIRLIASGINPDDILPEAVTLSGIYDGVAALCHLFGGGKAPDSLISQIYKAEEEETENDIIGFATPEDFLAARESIMTG